MKVTKYKLLRNVTVLYTLFLTRDIIYIQNYDPVGGRPQQVFDGEKRLLGKISKNFYWGLDKMIEIVKD